MTQNSEHYIPGINRYCYGKVPEQEVSTEMVERTKAMAAFVCADLRLCSPPEIVWIRPARKTEIPGTRVQDVVLEERKASFPRLREDIKGGYTPGCPRLHEIWIRADLKDYPALEYVVAHELRHVWQKLTRPDIFRSNCEAEGDAYPYGYSILKQSLKTHRTLTAELCSEIDQMCANTKAVFLATCPDTPFRAFETTPERTGA